MWTHLNILVNSIIYNYFQHQLCYVVYKSHNDKLQYHGPIPKIVFEYSSLNNEQEPMLYAGCQAFIINVDHPKTVFEILEAKMKLQHDKFNYRQYLIIATSNDSKTMEIFESPALEYVADFIIIDSNKEINKSNVIIKDWKYKNSSMQQQININNTNVNSQSNTTHINLPIFLNNYDDTIYNLYTHEYTGFHPQSLVLVDRYFAVNSSFLFNNAIFYDKLINQLGRSLRVATFTYKPYSIPDEVATKSDGTEMQIALLYALKHNMTVDLVLDEEGQWGDIFPNWTGYGIVGNLVKDQADVGLGALYTWERESMYLDLSAAVVRTGITVLVPAPTLAGGWFAPFLSFSIAMWITVVISFCFAVIAIASSNFIVNKINKVNNDMSFFQELIESFMIVCSVFLQQSVSFYKIPVNRVAKNVFGGICVLTVLVSSCYGSGLFSSMTIPRYVGAIKTRENLADSQLFWGATSDAWINSIVKDTNPTTVAIVSKFIIANETELMKFGKGRFGFSVERLPGGYFAIGNYIEYDNVINNLRLLYEDLYWENCVLMLRKSSILSPGFNKLILEINQAGLMPHWEFIAVSRHLDNKLQTALRYSIHHKEGGDYKNISLRTIEGAFLVLFIGETLSIIIFVYEILKKKQNINERGEY